MQDNTKRKRIGFLTIFFMVSFAVVIDTIQLILDLFGIGVLANRIIDVAVACILLFWFYMIDPALLTNMKIVGSVGAALIGEEIPVVDAFPFWAGDAAYTCITIMLEDAKYNEQILGIKQPLAKKTVLKSLSMSLGGGGQGLKGINAPAKGKLPTGSGARERMPNNMPNPSFPNHTQELGNSLHKWVTKQEMPEDVDEQAE
jgi:hypothetical protein